MNLLTVADVPSPPSSSPVAPRSTHTHVRDWRKNRPSFDTSSGTPGTPDRRVHASRTWNELRSAKLSLATLPPTARPQLPSRRTVFFGRINNSERPWAPTIHRVVAKSHRVKHGGFAYSWRLAERPAGASGEARLPSLGSKYRRARTDDDRSRRRTVARSQFGTADPRFAHEKRRELARELLALVRLSGYCELERERDAAWLANRAIGPNRASWLVPGTVTNICSNLLQRRRSTSDNSLRISTLTD